MDLIVKYPHSVEYKKKLYVPGEPLPNDIPKKEVERLMIKGRVEIPESDESGDSGTKSKKSEAETIDEMKAKITELETKLKTEAKARAEAEAKLQDKTKAQEKAKTPDLKDMTVPKLQKLCDELKISYGTKALKGDLIKLIEEKTAEPPKE